MGKDIRVVMLGLDQAGKTTILYKSKLGEIVTTVPTIGFNVETLQYKKHSHEFTVWDIGGQEKIAPLWRHYIEGTQVFVWVVDYDDKDRYPEAKDRLQKFIDSCPPQVDPFSPDCNAHWILLANHKRTSVPEEIAPSEDDCDLVRETTPFYKEGPVDGERLKHVSLDVMHAHVEQMKMPITVAHFSLDDPGASVALVNVIASVYGSKPVAGIGSEGGEEEGGKRKKKPWFKKKKEKKESNSTAEKGEEAEE